MLFLSSDQLGDLSGGDAAGKEGNKSLAWMEEGETEKVTKDARNERIKRYRRTGRVFSLRRGNAAYLRSKNHLGCYAMRHVTN